MDAERLWLVDRTYSDKGLVNLVYATTDGESHLRKQLSEQMLMRTDVTAAVDAEPDRLEPTPADDRERFAAEARRVADDHDPDDPI